MRHKLSQSGSALISMIIILPFLILICGLFMELAVSSITLARTDQSLTHAQLASDAGIDFALQQINQPASTWTTTGGQTTLQQADGVKTTYEVTLDETTRILTSVGRTFRPVSSTTASATKTINAKLRPITSTGFSIVTGVGGLFLSNSAKIVGGDVLVNGEIVMSNTTQIGLSTNPIKVEVAHQNCPVPATATYPRLCVGGENGQPISITNSARIYGTVRANNQSSSAGMSSPGLTSSSGVVAQPLPTHDRAAQKTAAVNNLTGTAASCDTNNGTRNWPANVKITGDVTVSKDCKITVNGNVWITGTLDMGGSGQLIVSNTLTTMPDIMIDGQNASFNNSSTIKSNSAAIGARLITYWSRAACSPDCPEVTGTDLYNSRNDETISFGNSASAPESTLYARWTQVNINNTGGIGALIGQTIRLSNSATITFGSVAAAGTTFWVLDGYRRSF